MTTAGPVGQDSEEFLRTGSYEVTPAGPATPEPHRALEEHEPTDRLHDNHTTPVSAEVRPAPSSTHHQSHCLRSLRSVDEPRGSTVGSRAQLPDHSPRSDRIRLSGSHPPHCSDDLHPPLVDRRRGAPERRR